MTQRPAFLGKRRWIALAALVTLALGQAGTMIVTAFATRDVFLFLRHGGATLPVTPLVTLAAAGVALCLLRAIEGRIQEAAGQSYAADIRRVIFRHVTHMPTRDVAQRRAGALALRYVGDLAAFKGWIARGVSRLISAAITIPTALVILYWLEPAFFWAALGPILAVMGGIVLLGRPLEAAHRDLRGKRARLAASMAERLPQGIALRRSGRMATELRHLNAHSRAIAKAGVHREGLAAMVRGLPDAGAGLAGALCLWTCIRLGLGIPDAVAALTALSMVIWPLRHLADIADRYRAYKVAVSKLDPLLTTSQLSAPPKSKGDRSAPAVQIVQARLSADTCFDLTLPRGSIRRLAGPSGSGKTALLLALAGLERSPAATCFSICGRVPGGLKTGLVLYLGRQTVVLRGSLRRDVTLGLGRMPSDREICNALEHTGLNDLVTRLGGLHGRIDEGRRNLTANEQSRLLLARALLSRPDIALIDADELGLFWEVLQPLIAHLEARGSAALIITSDREAHLRLGQPIWLDSSSKDLSQSCAPA